MTGKQDRRYRLPREARWRMLEQYASGLPTNDIAERFGVGASYVRKTASREGIRKGQPFPKPEPSPPPPDPPGQHLIAHRRVQRGFHLPPSLEPQYTKLLLKGMSRNAAAVQLGLKGGDDHG